MPGKTSRTQTPKGKKDTPADTLSVPSSTKPPRKLSNMLLRTLTILILCPLILWYATLSHETATSLVCFGLFVAGLEWQGLKRHLKVRLLSHTNSQQPLPASFPREEYPLPMIPLWSFSVISSATILSSLGVVAYLGSDAFLTVLLGYSLLCAVPVVLRDIFVDRAPIEKKSPEQLVKSNSHIQSSVKQANIYEIFDRFNPNPEEKQKSSEMQHNFLRMERYIAEFHQPAEQFLDVCLDIFGVMWVSCLACPLVRYNVEGVGVPWAFSTMMANFLNDICALLTGKALRYLHEKLKVSYNVRRADSDEVKSKKIQGASFVYRFILNFPHPLCPAISPNKSVEGALSGIIANAVTFAGMQTLLYHYLYPLPAPTVLDPRYNTLPVWLAVGVCFGLCGVFGDLFQSLVKRTAYVKDAGFLIPGHGGVLDRFDGMLLTFAFLYVVMEFMLSATAKNG